MSVARRLWQTPRWRVGAYSGLLLLISLSLWLTVLAPAQNASPPRTIPWWLFALGLLVADQLQIHLQAASSGISISPGDALVMVGLLAVPAPELLAAVAMTRSVALWRIGRRRALADFSNFAYYVFAATVMVAVFHVLGANPSMPLGTASLLALLATLGVDIAVESVVFPIQHGLLVGRLGVRHLITVAGFTAIGLLISAALAFNALVLFETQPLVLVALLPVLLMVIAAQRAAAGSAQAAQRFRFLYKSSQLLHNNVDLSERSEELLAGLAEAFASETVELIRCDVAIGGDRSEARAGAAILLRFHAPSHELLRESRPLRTPELGLMDELSAGSAVIAAQAGQAGSLQAFGRERGSDNLAVALVATPSRKWGLLVVSRPARVRRKLEQLDGSDADMLAAVAGEIALALERGMLDAEVTAVSAERAELEVRVSHDALTGLGNRLMFRELLERAAGAWRERREGFALVYIDLDKFKPVNDRYGHAAGDELLRQVAGRLKSSLRDPDVAVRLGGDEFAAVISDVADEATVALVAERLLGALRAPFQLEAATVTIAASIGVALADRAWDPGAGVNSLVRAADEAMYAAKQQGRDRWVLFTAADVGRAGAAL